MHRVEHCCAKGCQDGQELQDGHQQAQQHAGAGAGQAASRVWEEGGRAGATGYAPVAWPTAIGGGGRGGGGSGGGGGGERGWGCESSIAWAPQQRIGLRASGQSGGLTGQRWSPEAREGQQQGASWAQGPSWAGHAAVSTAPGAGRRGWAERLRRARGGRRKAWVTALSQHADASARGCQGGGQCAKVGRGGSCGGCQQAGGGGGR